MTAQRHLFDPGPAEGGLTDHQAAVLEAVETAGSAGGLTATQAGALVHSRRAIHPASEVCVWCKGDGRGVLEALKKRGLVRRRKTGVYQPTKRRDNGVIPF